MRGNLELFVSSADRERLAAILADRNSPQKHVWRAHVVLLPGDRVSTNEIRRRTGLGKVSVWRWQGRYIKAGLDGLLRDKTRPWRIPKLSDDKVAEVICRPRPKPRSMSNWRASPWRRKTQNDQLQANRGGSNIKIGRHFHATIYSYVAHDCRIGDFVTFAPAVKCNGNVIVEDGAYIGTGAVLRQGTPDKPLVIGRGAVVGMGAVVTKSVPAGVTVIGNPARPLEKKS